VKPTNFLNDCGIHSAGSFQNGDFAQKSAYWTLEGGANAIVGQGNSNGGYLYEGLYLQKGDYQFAAHVEGEGEMVVKNSRTGAVVGKKNVKNKEWKEKVLKFSILADGDYQVGVKGNISIKNCRVKK
jgi:hypothetical protein